jgi:tellurite resistance protein TerC
MGKLPLWVAFHVLVLALLALDLGVFRRRARVVAPREAALASAFWIFLALAFNSGIFFIMGPQRGLDFLTGYVIEYALSVDNVFVFAVLFRYFGVPAKSQHRVLSWGILGALVLRGTLVAVGAALLQRWSWALLGLGALVLFTGVRLLFHKPEALDPENSFLLRLARKTIPCSSDFRGDCFFARENGRLLATPLFLVLLVVEVTDVAFALDSVPTIFAVTRDPFIVYTSNVFAVLGLRAFYFLFAAMMVYFPNLSRGLAAILMFIGTKMLAEKWFHISTLVSLLVVAAVLALSLLKSALANGSVVVTRDKGRAEG